MRQFSKVLCTHRQNCQSLRQFTLFRKLRKICQPFSDSDHRKWNFQILQQIAQNLLNLPTLTTNHAKFAWSVPISQGSVCLYRCWHQPCSDLDHGKWNSQYLQQIVQNLCDLPTLTVNHAKFEQSAPISIYSKLRKFCNLKLQFANYQFLQNFLLLYTHWPLGQFMYCKYIFMYICIEMYTYYQMYSHAISMFMKYQFIFNVLLTREFRSLKSQFMKYQCLFSMYY